jgi:Nif-specific regulatory protein
MDPEHKELQLQILFEISQILSQATNLDQALEFILEVLSRSLPLKSATLALKDPETGRLREHASHSLWPEGTSNNCCHLGEGLAGLIRRTAQPFVVSSLTQEPVFLNQLQGRQIHKGQVSFFGVPIIFQGSLLGVLCVDRLSDAEASLEEDLCLLSAVAALLAPFASLEMAGRPPHGGLPPEHPALGREPADASGTYFIVGHSPAIQEVHQLIKKVAPGRAPVLLTGEAGVGKTLAARVIHELGPRGRYPFLKINCASLPENLLAAELFGYEKDAIPGAVKARPGRLEEADGGVLFLEEIGELSLNLQARIMRFLQELEFQRLGSNRTRKVDVRLLADTTQDLAAAVKAGSFREDLLYLLSHSPVQLPPLRERRQDIPLLLDHFLDKVSKDYGRRFYLTQKALEVLQDYSWPGNVREMENLLERLCIAVEGAEIGVKDLPAYLAPAAKSVLAEDQAFLSRLKEMEKREILAALERNRWIQSQAAMDLGLTLRQIGYRVKQFGLEKLIKEQRGQGRSL